MVIFCYASRTFLCRFWKDKLRIGFGVKTASCIFDFYFKLKLWKFSWSLKTNGSPLILTGLSWEENKYLAETTGL